MSDPIPPAEHQPASQPVDYSAYASSRQPADGGTARTRNPLGLFAAIAGAAGVLLGALLTLVQAAIAGTGNYTFMGSIGAIQNVLTVLLGLAALVLGGIALLTRQGSRVLAAVGVALGASFLVNGVVSLLYSLILQVTSRY